MSKKPRVEVSNVWANGDMILLGKRSRSSSVDRSITPSNSRSPSLSSSMANLSCSEKKELQIYNEPKYTKVISDRQFFHDEKAIFNDRIGKMSRKEISKAELETNNAFNQFFKPMKKLKNTRKKDEENKTKIDRSWEFIDMKRLELSESGMTTRWVDTMTVQYAKVPDFIVFLVNRDYEKSKEALEKYMGSGCEPSNHKRRCKLCLIMWRGHHLETILSLPLNEVHTFFTFISEGSKYLKHFIGMLVELVFDSHSYPMFSSLISAGHSQQVLVTIDYMNMHANPMDDSFCFVNCEMSKRREKESLLSLLIESGANEEIVMEFYKRNLFCALDIEDGMLSAIKMNDIERVLVVENLRIAMEEELKEMESNRQKKMKNDTPKWKCRTEKNDSDVCRGLIFEYRRNDVTILHQAVMYATGEVLHFVLNKERAKIKNNKHPQVDVPDKYLYTPLMTALKDGNQDLIHILIHEFGARISRIEDSKGGIPTAETAFTVAVDNGQFDWLEDLARICRSDKSGIAHRGCPIARCVRNGRFDQVTRMIKMFEKLKGNELVWEDHLTLALFEAIAHRNKEIALELVRNGAKMEESALGLPFEKYFVGWEKTADEIKLEMKRTAENKNKNRRTAPVIGHECIY